MRLVRIEGQTGFIAHKSGDEIPSAQLFVDSIQTVTQRTGLCALDNFDGIRQQVGPALVRFPVLTFQKNGSGFLENRSGDGPATMTGGILDHWFTCMEDVKILRKTVDNPILKV